MALVQTNRRKIAALEADDIRRLFTRSVNEWIKENQDDLIENPNAETISGIVTELTSLWTDAIEILIDTAVDTVVPVMVADLLEDEDDADEDDSEDDEDPDSESDVVEAELVEDGE